MYRVFKRFKIPFGHRLSKHAGRCFNIHGHNFLIEIQISCSELNENDMVIDFHDLKVIINELIDKFDHAIVLNPFDKVNIEHFKNLNYRVEFISETDTDPTAEIFSSYLFHKFDKAFPNHTIDFVRVWESDDAMAEWSL